MGVFQLYFFQLCTIPSSFHGNNYKIPAVGKQMSAVNVTLLKSSNHSIIISGRIIIELFLGISEWTRCSIARL